MSINARKFCTYTAEIVTCNRFCIILKPLYNTVIARKKDVSAIDCLFNILWFDFLTFFHEFAKGFREKK